jgi:hypothetical protein
MVAFAADVKTKGLALRMGRMFALHAFQEGSPAGRMPH